MKALEAIGRAILIIDGDGTIQACNRLAADLLDCDSRPVVGQRCWTIARLQSPDGTAFCGPDCALRRRAREQGFPWCQATLLRAPTSPALDIELLTFPLPPRPGVFSPILHFLAPLPVNREIAELEDYPHPLADVPRGLARLTRREMAVLRLLASGLRTPDVAATLFISPVTVRNHVENVLRKLEVHNRLDAVLMWMGGTSTPPKTARLPRLGTARHGFEEE